MISTGGPLALVISMPLNGPPGSAQRGISRTRSSDGLWLTPMQTRKNARNQGGDPIFSEAPDLDDTSEYRPKRSSGPRPAQAVEYMNALEVVAGGGVEPPTLGL